RRLTLTAPIIEGLHPLPTSRPPAGQPDFPFDADDDGLIDIDEMELFRTNPKKADTTGDGISDVMALRLGLDPADATRIHSASPQVHSGTLYSATSSD